MSVKKNLVAAASGTPIVLIGPQIANGSVVTLSIYSDGTTVLQTPNYNGGNPGGGPFTVTFDPNVPLATIYAFIHALTGM